VPVRAACAPLAPPPPAGAAKPLAPLVPPVPLVPRGMAGAGSLLLHAVSRTITSQAAPRLFMGGEWRWEAGKGQPVETGEPRLALVIDAAISDISADCECLSGAFS